MSATYDAYEHARRALTHSPTCFAAPRTPVTPHSYPVGETVREAPPESMRPPSGLAFDKGAIVFGAFGPDAGGVYEIYAANTTGWEPLTHDSTSVSSSLRPSCVLSVMLRSSGRERWGQNIPWTANGFAFDQQSLCHRSQQIFCHRACDAVRWASRLEGHPWRAHGIKLTCVC